MNNDSNVIIVTVKFVSFVKIKDAAGGTEEKRSFSRRLPAAVGALQAGHV